MVWSTIKGAIFEDVAHKPAAAGATVTPVANAVTTPLNGSTTIPVPTSDHVAWAEQQKTAVLVPGYLELQTKFEQLAGMIPEPDKRWDALIMMLGLNAESLLAMETAQRTQTQSFQSEVNVRQMQLSVEADASSVQAKAKLDTAQKSVVEVQQEVAQLQARMAELQNVLQAAQGHVLACNTEIATLQVAAETAKVNFSATTRAVDDIITAAQSQISALRLKAAVPK